ncbi:MAG: 1-(5-phosphoribosyl)-5-[(5-phosphoribosylamino)methylideneamino]imidazole-4-carboxamide isomerase [Candidatus Omnitrophica bacterium]|nr:1-(5-phosphoribosyl)-5-[(5-phosphoribosylamino)methylideneamino]imidazole-4-carboxamide isomerase [Candidatus Omnitrophota bacterium]MCM8831715.1 1-(5-phosphoribosyl)-5-[(5-phosphoribosylamino)methylideneamino]imidazole-4-carboxamide isomerase [Candidatus Omnitrophota bacterium]
MLIIPAIDLFDGKVVRLTQGRLDTAKIYSNNPLEVARNFKEQGAEFLHIVDLSAAFEKGDNFLAIEEILSKVKIKIQVGGGIRTIKKAKRLIKIGVKRVIVGTKSLDETFLDKLCKEIGPQKVIVSVDVKDKNIAIKGWRKKTKLDVFEFIKRLHNKKLRWIIYTDILKDGTLSGVNLENIKKLSIFKNLNILISGGISCLEDLMKIKKEASFLWAVIVGKAIYENKINLKDAINMIK